MMIATAEPVCKFTEAVRAALTTASSLTKETPTMDKTTIAVPSAFPGGLDAAIDEHFGHCEVYTIVELKNRQIASVATVPSLPHDDGGCIAPVRLLAEKGVDVLIARGMGMRPLKALKQLGIDVYCGAGAPSVQSAVQAFIAGSIRPFGPVDTCAH
ncbi:MAG: NifB/NifX family molybdenum-iron cluster-binding protein [Candidatus Baltobacteraceae bacterium]